MSCRRRDKRRFIGCNIGDVGVRGCSRECCPYLDENKFKETHPHVRAFPDHDPLPLYLPDEATSEEQRRRGRTGLRWRKCGAASYKPKFICPRPQCRRLFKPFFDDDMFEYRISSEGWETLPNLKLACNRELRLALRGMHSQWHGFPDNRWAELVTRYYTLHNLGQVPCRFERYFSVWSPSAMRYVKVELDPDKLDQKPLSEQELIKMGRLDLERRLNKIIGVGHDHKKRCPGCGEKGIRVGSNFRVPSRKDEKGWKKVEEMIAQGTDMLASFEPCATVEEYNDWVVKANEQRELAIHTGIEVERQ